MAELSVVIPARNEMFLAKTVENILSNIEGDTEVIAVLDGTWADPKVPDDPRVTVLHYSKSVGQRAATNRAVMLSKAKYIMKCDAHCAFDKGFDIKMIREMHDDWTMVPLMKNLHAFDWICKNGHRRYQGPSGPCKECGEPTTRDVMWEAKPSPNSVSYCFDSAPHFQYFGDWPKRPAGRGEITETMSLQGSCFMLTRDKYWELNICDENFGSWGSQGIEVAVKTWLSGGAVMVNKKTWYAHMFRTQGGDFGFPYPISGSDQEKAKKFARDLFFNNNWPLQKKPLSWLVEKFWPVPGWTDDDLKKLKENKFNFKDNPDDTKPAESEPLEEKFSRKGMVYVTDHLLKLRIASTVQKHLIEISRDASIPLTVSSIKPMNIGDINTSLGSDQPGGLTNLKLILEGLKKSNSEIVFLCKNDVLYDKSHFDFTPEKKDIFYYNQNWWKVRLSDGLTVHWDANNLFALCGYRETLINFYENLLKKASEGEYDEENMITPGEEAGKIEAWNSELPNIELKLEQNFDFKVKSIKNFSATGEIPGKGKSTEFIKYFQ